MGINQVPIVNQYADINRRLIEIEQGDQQGGFRLPDGVSIINSTDVGLVLRGGGMYFILRTDAMYLVRTRTSTNETSDSHRGRMLIKYLMQYWPHLRYSEMEIVIGREGIAWLAKQVGLT